MRTTISAILFASFIGCANTGLLTRDISEPDRMNELLSANLPVGTLIEDAKKLMSKEGFSISTQLNESFLDREGIDFLWCDRSVGSIVQRRWQVAVVFREGKVVEILSSTGMVGP